MKRWSIVLACCFAVFLLRSPFCEAGERGPGKYCGVAVFDRWDGCTLYSGIYVMYVSEKTKEDLRAYAGQAIQIDAKEVYQPINPGDGRIGKLTYLGPAPESRNWVKLEGIHLESAVTVRDDGKVIATITVENRGDAPIKLFSQELALTLLLKRDETERKSWSVPDGPSFALITRQSFESGGSEPRWEGKGLVAVKKPYAWTIGKEHALPHEFTLGPKEKKQIDVQFDIPDGQYDFLCGYGGGVHDGKCLASGLSAFDVENGKAKTVEIKNRDGKNPDQPLTNRLAEFMKNNPPINKAGQEQMARWGPNAALQKLDKPLQERLSAILEDVQTVKPGMTRRDLLKMFSPEGGISTRTNRTYGYRYCPYVKVDVKFEATGELKAGEFESPADLIKEISKPYLQRMIGD